MTYAIGLLLLLAARHHLAEFYRSEVLAALVIPAALAVLPGLWYGILAAGLQGLQQFRALGTVALAQAVVTLAGTLIVLALGGGAWELFVLAIAVNGLGLALAARAGGSELRPQSPRELEPALRARMWRYGLTLGVLGIPAALLSERLEVFFLGRFWAPADVAFYSLAAGLALHARRLGPSALGEVLFPVIARLEGRRDAWGVANAYVHSTRYLVMAGWPVALGGALLAEPLIRLLFGAAYAPAVPALVILVVGAGIVAMGHPAVAVIYSQERNTFLIVSSLAIVVLNIGLDLVLIPPWGAVGAALANAVVQAVLLAVHTLWVSRWLGVRPPVADALRSLAAAILAFAPAMVLQSWPAGPFPVALLVVTGTGGLPVAARRLGGAAGRGRHAPSGDRSRATRQRAGFRGPRGAGLAPVPAGPRARQMKASRWSPAAALRSARHRAEETLSATLNRAAVQAGLTMRVDGMRVRVSPAAMARALWRDRHVYDRDLAFYRRYLRPGDAVVDVGANIGLATLVAAKIVGPTGRIIAVEPHPRTFEYLRDNVQLNGLTDVVRLYCAALGEREGQRRIVEFPGDDSQNRLGRRRPERDPRGGRAPGRPADRGGADGAVEARRRGIREVRPRRREPDPGHDRVRLLRIVGAPFRPLWLFGPRPARRAPGPRLSRCTGRTRPGSRRCRTTIGRPNARTCSPSGICRIFSAGPATGSGARPSGMVFDVVVVNYNTDSYLFNLLVSVRDRLPIGPGSLGVHVWDNASTDRSLSMLAAFAAQAPWLRVHRSPVNVYHGPALDRLLQGALPSGLGARARLRRRGAGGLFPASAAVRRGAAGLRRTDERGGPSALRLSVLPAPASPHVPPTCRRFATTARPGSTSSGTWRSTAWPTDGFAGATGFATTDRGRCAASTPGAKTTTRSSNSPGARAQRQPSTRERQAWEDRFRKNLEDFLRGHGPVPVAPGGRAGRGTGARARRSPGTGRGLAHRAPPRPRRPPSEGAVTAALTSAETAALDAAPTRSA